MNRKGFTLIELLVVIAIIAILAAILFPVFQRVRLQTRQTQCMTQMHDIWTNVSLYKEDYNKYPAALYGFAEINDNSGNFYQGAPPPKSIHGLNYKPLFKGQKYMRDDAIFQCPHTKDKDQTKAVTAVYPNGVPLSGTYTFATLVHNLGKDTDPLLPSKSVYFYAYDSYDVQPKLNSTLDGPDPGGTYEVHYALDWTGATNSSDFAQYPNQLKYGPKVAGDSTVLTWCNIHAANAGSDKTLVMSLNGKAKTVSKVDFQQKGPLQILR